MPFATSRGFPVELENVSELCRKARKVAIVVMQDLHQFDSIQSSLIFISDHHTEWRRNIEEVYMYLMSVCCFPSPSITFHLVTSLVSEGLQI